MRSALSSVLLALAAQSLAGAMPNIGTLNLTPDVLTSLLSSLSAGTAPSAGSGPSIGSGSSIGSGPSVSAAPSPGSGS